MKVTNKNSFKFISPIKTHLKRGKKTCEKTRISKGVTFIRLKISDTIGFNERVMR